MKSYKNSNYAQLLIINFSNSHILYTFATPSETYQLRLN